MIGDSVWLHVSHHAASQSKQDFLMVMTEGKISKQKNTNAFEISCITFVNMRLMKAKPLAEPSARAGEHGRARIEGGVSKACP